MCTSSGSRESKVFENEFDSINADLGMNQEVIFMRVDIGFVTLLRTLAGKMKLPCFHFYKDSKLMASLSTSIKQELVDKILALKDKSPGDDALETASSDIQPIPGSDSQNPDNDDTNDVSNSGTSDTGNDDL